VGGKQPASCADKEQSQQQEGVPGIVRAHDGYHVYNGDRDALIGKDKGKDIPLPLEPLQVPNLPMLRGPHSSGSSPPPGGVPAPKR